MQTARMASTKNNIACFKIFLILVIFIIGSCATTSMFTPYPFQIEDVKQNIENKNFNEALSSLSKRRNTQDETLYMLESARVAQLGSEFKASIESFEIAIENERQVDERARISLSETTARGVALISSDNVIPYQASAYERVLMYHYQAMNYLAIGEWEAASVEVRRAALEQTVALERHQKELTEAQEQARKEGLNSQDALSQVDSQFNTMYAAARNVKNSFQNAYTFYFSAVIWEKLGEYNDAYIDYKKALEIFPENSYLQKDVVRLAYMLDFRDELDLFTKKFGIKPDVAVEEAGEIVILYEEDYVPAKEEAIVHLALPSGFHSVALPFYGDVRFNPGRLQVFHTGKVMGNSELIVDIRALAIKSLQEKMPGIVIRQVLRVLAKSQLQQTARDQLGSAGQIFSMLYSAASERADRRSWLTLPRNAQVFRTRLPKGQYDLQLSSTDNGRSSNISVNILANKITVLQVVATHSELFVRLL